MKPKKKVKVRKKWVINPKTRVKESKKVYSRKRTKSRFKKELKEENNEIKTRNT